MPEEIKRAILWQFWANETGLLSSYLIILGGITGIVGGILHERSFEYWWSSGIYALIVGFIQYVIEYPRSQKPKGNSLPRSHQNILSAVVEKMPLVDKLSYRALFYFLIAAPCFVTTATFLGGVASLVSCAIYIKASIKGEKWTPIKPRVVKTKAQGQGRMAAPSIRAPTRPPPRAGQAATVAESYTTSPV